MNKYIYSAAAFLSLSCIALTSCQNEMEQIGTPAGKEVLLRVTANRGDAETRTTLKHDGNGNLTCNWSEGDQLLVVENSKGTKLGVITITDGVGTPDGTFEGKVNLDGQEALSLVYLGNAGNAESYESNNIAIDLSKQDGSFSSLPKLDVLTAEAKVDDQNFLPTGNVIETTITMTRQLAFGHFTLDFGSDVTLAAGDVITIAGEGLRSEGKVNFKNGGNVPTLTNYSGSTTITVTKAEAGNDFYITMLPCGNVSPTFTVVKDGETYTAALGEHNWKSGEYVRAFDTTNSTESGVTVEMKKKQKPIDDGKLFGLKWAPANSRSYIDASPSYSTVSTFTYIPEIPFVEQGLGDFDYISGDKDKFVGENNPYFYHYQWDRDFGFIASDDAYDYSITRLPNYTNLPSGFRKTNYAYQYSESKSTMSNAIEYFDVYYYPTNNVSYDWCSNTGRTEWGNRFSTYGYSVMPLGFDLPKKSDFENLLPEGENKEYTVFGKSIKVSDQFGDEFTVKPFYVKNLEDGTTVVWSIMTSSSNNYLDVRRLDGLFTKDQLNETTMQTEVSVNFSANGYRTNSGVLQYKTRGFYWAKDCPAGTQTGYAACFSFTFNSSSNPTTIKLATGAQPRKYALAVRCIYED
ncbi:MAG: fimbrillin family protein [Muribaculaceae bacterium]|nr:fimbrillin family protein [Muribaculaceae bacterium]